MALRAARKALTTVGILIAGWVTALAGCSPRSMLVPDLPPETTVFVSGDIDTVNHVVHLYWFGTDPDGDVVGFEVRFLNPAAPADTQWVPTTRTDSVFTVQAPSGFTRPVFQARAIDDDGLRDPTPASQEFQFRNEPPAVSIDVNNAPVFSDSTIGTATLSWVGSDIDGDVGALRFRVWLNGNEAASKVVTGTTYTLLTEDFLESGELRSGYRKVFVQPIDDGGRAGEPDSVEWYVRAPVTVRPRLLIIDDVPSNDGNNELVDTLYANTAERNLPGRYDVLRLQYNRAFRSALDLEQTCKLYDVVIWYRGPQLTFSTVMRDYQDGLSAYLEQGGTLFLEGLHLIEGEGINSTGALRPEFLRDHLGSDGLYRAFIPGQPDSSSSWGIGNNDTLRVRAPCADSMRYNGIFDGVRGFIVRDPSYALVVAPGRFPTGTLNPAHPFDIPVAVSVPQPSGGGRAIAVSFPVARGNRTFVAGGSTNTARVMAGFFRELGLVSGTCP
jgi:hypothetical protein